LVAHDGRTAAAAAAAAAAGDAGGGLAFVPSPPVAWEHAGGNNVDRCCRCGTTDMDPPKIGWIDGSSV